MKDSNLVYDRCVIEVFSISTVMWRSQSFLHRQSPRSCVVLQANIEESDTSNVGAMTEECYVTVERVESVSVTFLQAWRRGVAPLESSTSILAPSASSASSSAAIFL